MLVFVYDCYYFIDVVVYLCVFNVYVDVLDCFVEVVFVFVGF